MTPPLLAIACILAAAGGEAPDLGAPTREDSRRFAAEHAAAAHDPDALVQLALWAESRGLKAERAEILKEAVAIDAHHEAARGLLGEILHEGKWLPAEQVAERIRGDASLAAKHAEYETRRAAMIGLAVEELRQARDLEENGDHEAARLAQARANRKLAPGHVKLGMWCEENGLKPEALAHFSTAVRLDPHRESTWKHLGYAKFEGRWMPRDQVQAARREASQQEKADASWEPQLRRLKANLAEKNRQEAAEARLDEIADPRAVPMIAKVFGAGGETDQARAVKMLGKIASTASTRELSALAVRSDFSEVRFQAAELLKGREPRDYAETLVNLIRKPWSYQYQPVQGPGTKGALVVDSPRFRMLRTYDAPPIVHLAATFRGYVGVDPNGLPIVISGAQLSQIRSNVIGAGALRVNFRENAEWNRSVLERAESRTAQYIAEAQIKAEAAQARMSADIQEIEFNNAEAVAQNGRIAEVLKQTLDAPSLGDEEDSWQTWWHEQAGYRYTPPPKVTITQEYQSLPPPTIQSCFAAGTPVKTRDGHRPIETLSVGDQVLCQDASTGRLGFQPILATHHNPPDRTVRVILDDGDEIVASLFHRFWLAGKGWAMARDLKAGESVRTFGGRSRILKVEPGPNLPVYNLDVAGGRTYFVGRHDALVHDNTLPDLHATPFDAGAATVDRAGR